MLSACWTRGQKVEGCPACMCREKNILMEVKENNFAVNLLQIFLWLIYSWFFFLSGLLNLLVLMREISHQLYFYSRIIVQLRQIYALRKYFDFWKVLFEWHRAPDVSLGKPTPWDLSYLAPFQYTGPGSTRNNNSDLSLSFLGYFYSDWRGIARLE